MLKFLYSTLAIISCLSYWSARHILIAQEPFGETIISNLTLNIVLGPMVLGAFSPKITRKIWPKAPRGTFIVTALILGFATIELLSLFGVETKW